MEAVIAATPSNAGIQPYFAVPPQLEGAALAEYLRHNLPVRLGSPLFTKLQKRYSTLPRVQGLPIVLALQDFHDQGSLSLSSTTLSHYLYGLRQNWYLNAEGQLVIAGEALNIHQVGSKQIPSGFFKQPDAEHISAVLFANSGTVPKFARMGQQQQFRSPAVRMLRWGSCYRHDPNATMPDGFVYEVGAPGEGLESWSEGTILIHNPHAIAPLPDGWLGASADERLENGNVTTVFPEPLHPYFSFTEFYPGNLQARHLQQRVDGLTDFLLTLYPP